MVLGSLRCGKISPDSSDLTYLYLRANDEDYGYAFYDKSIEIIGDFFESTTNSTDSELIPQIYNVVYRITKTNYPMRITKKLIHNMKILPKDIKVSIIIPVYNVAPYVEECIQSVLRQDYKNLEIIIIIDDCGTDNSMELVENLVKNSSRDIVILKHDYNKGLSAARNTGIRRATGDYIFFLDSDDFIESYCISVLVKTAKIYINADMVYGSSFSSGGYLPENILNRHDLDELYDNRKQIKSMMLNYTKFPLTIWNRLIKRSWLLKHNLFFKEGIVLEDLHWNFYAAKYVTSIALCKKTTHYYRCNPNGIMNSQEEKIIESGYIILKDWILNLDRHCLFKQLYSIFHLAHITYVRKYGGANRQKCIRVFYPLICILEMFIKNIQKYWLNPKSNRR